MLDPDERRGQTPGRQCLDHGAHGREVGVEASIHGGSGQAIQAGVREGVEELDGDDIGGVGGQRGREQHVVGQPRRGRHRGRATLREVSHRAGIVAAACDLARHTPGAGAAS